MSGNSTDLHVNDQIYLQPQDYGSGLNNNNSNQGNNALNDSLFFHMQPARLDRGARYPAPTAPSHSGLLRAVMLVSPSSAVFTPYSKPRFIRTDSGNGNGNPYMTINDCSAAGNHSCEYSIVPIVNLAASNSLGGGGLETITGFVCVHVLSASTGTVNVTFSTGCISNTTSSVGGNSTYYGVSSPPRLAQ
ncbi:MAG: hypothetical protein WJ306_03125 [Ferrovum myxofaciens]